MQKRNYCAICAMGVNLFSDRYERVSHLKKQRSFLMPHFLCGYRLNIIKHLRSKQVIIATFECIRHAINQGIYTIVYENH